MFGKKLIKEKKIKERKRDVTEKNVALLQGKRKEVYFIASTQSKIIGRK